MLRQPLLFTYLLPKHLVFLIHPLFPTKSDRLPLATYPWLCSTCVTDRKPCHAIGHQVLPTPAFNVIPHPSMSYRQVFRPILHFQPNSLQSDSQQFPTQLLPRETEDFPRGGNHSKHVSLLTYLAWFQPIYYDLGFVFIHVKLWTFLLVVKTLIKKHRAAATLISNYESRN